LICVPSPRDLTEFQEALDKLPYDKYVVKYETETVAYPKLRDFFLEHKEYETMVLFADDLLVHEYGLKHLLEEHREHPDDVISGICNFDMWNNKNKYCFRLVGDLGEYCKFASQYENGLRDYFEKYAAVSKYENGHLWKVEFNAFACMVVSRRIIEEVPFRFDREEGGGVDQNFCDDVRKRGYDCLIDIMGCGFIHLAGRKNGHLEEFYVGIKEPTAYLTKSRSY